MSPVSSGVAPLTLGALLTTASIIAVWPLLPGPWRLALAISGPSLSLLCTMALWRTLNYLDALELERHNKMVERAQIPGSDAGVSG